MKESIRWFSSVADFRRLPMCENAVRNHDINYGHGIAKHQCYDNPAEFQVTIDYGYEQSPPAKVCRRCLETIKSEAREHNFKLRFTRLHIEPKRRRT